VAREKQQGTEAMDAAIVDRAFLFHYQPIVDTRARRILAYEALARGTRDPLRFPDVIFSTAERCDRIWELGRVLRDIAADGLDGWVGSEATPDPLLFINVHPRDIEDPVFLEQALSGGLARHAHRVVIELTERAAIADYRRVKPFFATLRRRGFRLAIDDLGSGYAGLTSLAELEPDFIKFDMGLVRDLHLHPVKQRLIERMNEFAEEIGAQTISEGVETAEERDALVRAGCCHMQGYFFARPAPRPPEIPAERWPDPVAD
jgi:EAL domain-containing protein (putative c-di-GMP-specific phosphodiesterase class I)